MFGPIPSLAATSSYSATPAVSIPDNGCPTYTNINILATDNMILSDINVGVNISHTYQSNLRINLTSPSGTTIFLSNGSGNSSNNFDIMFDDSATTSITSLSSSQNVSSPYYENLFRPTNALSVFNGQNIQGNWVVGVCDKAVADTGIINRIQLNFTGTNVAYPADAGAAVCRSAASQSFTPIRHYVSWPHNDPIGTLNPSIWDMKVASAQPLVPAAGLVYAQAQAYATDYVVKNAATTTAQAAWSASDYLTYTFTTANTVEASDFLSVLSYGLYSIRTFGQRITVLLSESANFATATEVLSNYLVSAPTSVGYSVVNVPVDKRVYIKPSTTYYMRVLFHNLPDPVAGAHWDDWAIGFASCADYGDISSSYGAARHKMPANDGLRLGTLAPDAEDAMAVSTDANGDDTNGSDDEDGITLPVLVQGQTNTISATVAGAGGYLQGWIDWNGNGVFDSSEQIASNLQDNGAGDTNSAAGTVAFNVNVPANATTTPTYARFRWSSTVGLNSTDIANDGEIEDYRLTVTATSCTPLLASDAYSDEFVQWMHNANTPLGAPANNVKAYIRQPIYAASASDEGFNNLTAAVPNTESHIQTASIPAAWDTSRYISYSFTTSAFLGSATLYGVGLGVHGDARPTYDKRSGAYRLKVLVDTDPNFGSPTNLINGIRIDDTQPNLDASVSWPVQDLGSSRYYFNHYQATQVELLAPNTTYYVRVYPYSATRSGYDGAYGSNDIIYDDFTLKLKSCAYDLGDAPASYGSPNHLVTSTTYLGANAPDGQDAFAGTLNGMNDDATGIDDEDGITLPTLTRGQIATISATVTGAGGYLQGWIDWNGDGDFADSSEQVATNIQDNLVGDSNNTAGTIAFMVNVPATAVTTPTYARFRWSSTSGLNSTAAANDGEVEDYALTTVPASLVCQANAVTNGSFENALNGWTNGGNWESYGVASNVSNTNASFPLSQHLSNIEVGAGYITLYFSFASTNCNFCSGPSIANMDVTFNGTTYANFYADTSDKVTPTAQNGAALSPSASFSQTTTGASFQVTGFTLQIPWSGSSPASGTLAFVHRPDGGQDDTWVDNVSVCALAYDYGDAPSGYGSPMHQILSGMRLGATIDRENAAQPNVTATGDDTAGTNDEDGVTLPTLTQGQTATISATVTGAGGYLQGWIDWNGDGDFADSGEQVATNIQDNLVGDTNNAVGTIAFNVTVPANAVTTPTYARFRWSTTPSLNATTAANDGEVEDYALTILAANAAPIITSNGGGDTASITLPELTTLVTTVTATDADNDVLTYSINGGVDAARFTIDANTGVLSFITAPDFEAPSDADANNSYLVQVVARDGKGGVDTQLITITITNLSEGVSLSVRGLLQGPYDASTHLMLDNLRVLDLIPTNQPYSNYSSFNYRGNETVSRSRLAVTGFAAVVDWVLVELRSTSNPSVKVAQKAALLTREGLVVDAATNSDQLFIDNVVEGSYYVVLRHRNHLAVMTQNPIALATNSNTVVDFRLHTTPTYGAYAQFINSSNRALMRAGNANLDNSLIANGPDNDTNAVLLAILMAETNTTLNANYVYKSYLNTDINMDGFTIFAGPNNDLNFLIGNIIFHPANATASENYVVLGGAP